MKQVFIFSIALLLASFQLPANPLSIGDQMPDFSIHPIGQEAPVSLSDFRGKVVVLEFWATWCSPCIGGMQHLQGLRDRFGEELIVIALSNERPERIAKFIANTGFSFLFAPKSTELDDYFPHRVIPHTVVISPGQQVAAITRPEALTEESIARLLRGSDIALPLKEDHPWDLSTDIFNLDTSARQSFQIQPARPEAPTYSRSYNAGPFQGRRHSFVNFQIPMLYRDAFNTTVYRMDYPEDTPETYCVDILVREGEETRLTDILRDSLDAYFGWTAAWQLREMDVCVLSASEEGVKLAPADTQAAFKAAGDHFRSEGATIAAFAGYLESYGIVGMPVEDETGTEQLYLFDFSFEPENPESFFEALTQMGLKVKKEKRTIDVLVVRTP